ncbi:MAG: FAD-binding protein [Mucinivorans sp.]
MIQLNLTPKEAHEKAANLAANERITRRSIDARRRGDVRVLLSIESGVPDTQSEAFKPQNVSAARPVIVVGSGPAGLFAAIELIERGMKPIVLERGLPVSARKVDIAAISRGQAVPSNSNYCFGEGGAGTFSDGKLYTRSKKRGNNQRVLEIFHHFGADPQVLYQAHPHIGTDKLPRIIENMRNSIIECGGEIRFESHVNDLLIENNVCRGVVIDSGEQIMAQAVILATGHSSRDVYELLHNKGVLLEAKPFAVGLRVEHKQSLIDTIQYKSAERGPYLPAASYSLAVQSKDRGVYSFCMCPGGFIVPAATAAGECVVNGMSTSGHNNIYANAGVVTEVRIDDLGDFAKHFGVLAGLQFQRQLEQMAFAQGGGQGNRAPGEGLLDFVGGKTPSELLPTSYHPGLTLSAMDRWLPKFVSAALRDGLKQFDQKMRGYLTADAQVIGVESRTSSPVRIPRNPLTFCHVQVAGLYPSGEGSGYAGGILSSAVDGIAVAAAVSEAIGS